MVKNKFTFSSIPETMEPPIMEMAMLSSGYTSTASSASGSAVINLPRSLFEKSGKIILTSGLGKIKTNTMGPAGIGYSTKRPSSARGASKFSGAAKIFDYLLIEHNINIVEGEDKIYMETIHDGIVYHALANAKEVKWAEEAPKEGFLSLMPSVAFALSDRINQSELREIFSKALDNYISSSVIPSLELLLFCDSFYYGFAVQNSEIRFYEHEPILKAVKQAYVTGQLKTMDIIKDIVDDLPTFDAFSLKEGRTAKEFEAKKKGSIYEEIRNGDFIIPYSWNLKQSEIIPSIKTLDEFVPNQTFYSIANKMKVRLNKVLTRLDSGLTGVDAIKNDYVNVAIIGKPGTGKTTAAYALGAATGMPVYTVSISKNTEEDECARRFWLKTA